MHDKLIRQHFVLTYLKKIYLSIHIKSSVWISEQISVYVHYALTRFNILMTFSMMMIQVDPRKVLILECQIVIKSLPISLFNSSFSIKACIVIKPFFISNRSKISKYFIITLEEIQTNTWNRAWRKFAACLLLNLTKLRFLIHKSHIYILKTEALLITSPPHKYYHNILSFWPVYYQNVSQLRYILNYQN